GAFLWVLLASGVGWPVSTTHALTGAILGTALAAGGASGVRWALALKMVAAPLAFSPIAAGGIAYTAHALVSRRLSAASRYCVCVRERPLMVVPQLQPGAAAAVRPLMLPRVIVDEARAC